MKKLVLFSLFAMNLVDQPAPLVRIAQGILSGKINKDGTVLEYMGIPYATAEKRFQAPGPPPQWEGVYKAINEMYTCPQPTSIGVIGTEDCLTINVYVPAFARGPLPVMVWIHGGAFLLGSSGKLLYGPDFIVKKDVILVTFNYRLGALGFMCLGIKEAPGNAGLKDQVAALRWVKNNIAAFGGDPDNVTLFGESAGGTSTSLLIASEITNGLFNKAIVQSGTAIANWAINRKPIWTSSLLAKELGYITEDPKELYKIFSEMNYKDLVALKATKPLDLFFEAQLFHLPCIEENIPGVESVISDLPYNLLTKSTKNVTLLYGTTNREGLYLIHEETTPESLEQRNGRYLFAADLVFPTQEEAFKTAKQVKEFYFGDDKISIANVMNMSDLYTHLYFEVPVILETKLFISKMKSPVYNYIFSYSGGRNFLKNLSGFPQEDGACHGDDFEYLFDGNIFPLKPNKEDAKFIDDMTTMWTNFAKHGNPTPNDLPVRWQPSTRNSSKFLYIDSEFRMDSMPNPQAYLLWKGIYDKYRNTDIRKL